jgi:preprotein translocase subunit SecD
MKVYGAAAIIALFVMGCARENAAAQNAATSKMLTTACPLYVRSIEDDGKLTPYPFIRPEHVASIQVAKPFYTGEHAMWVTLTDIGAKRMLEHTEHAIGHRIAFYCDKTELERAVIQGPISASFRVSLP